MTVNAAISAAEQAYIQYRSLAGYLRKISILYENEFQAVVAVPRVRAVFQDFRRTTVEIQDLRSSTGMVAMCRRIRNDPAYDLQAEITELIGLLDAARREAKKLVPLSADGTFADTSWAIDDKYDNPPLDIMDMSDLRTALIAVRDAIVFI